MNLNENNFIEIISNSKGGFTHLSLFINHNGDSVTELPYFKESKLWIPKGV